MEELLFIDKLKRIIKMRHDDVVSAMPVTNPFLKELMGTFLKAGGRKGNESNTMGMDFDELGVSEVVDLLDDDAVNIEAVKRDFGDKNPQEDPVIHFFEGFLQNVRIPLVRSAFCAHSLPQDRFWG